MNIEIVKGNSNCKNVRVSKVKVYFDKLINQFLDNIKEQLNVEKTDDVVNTLNEFLEKNTIKIELNEKELEEFKKVSRRQYTRSGDSCKFIEDDFTTDNNGPKQFISSLLDNGIKPPIWAKIYRENKTICIKFNRMGWL